MQQAFDLEGDSENGDDFPQPGQRLREDESTDDDGPLGQVVGAGTVVHAADYSLSDEQKAGWQVAEKFAGAKPLSTRKRRPRKPKNLVTGPPAAPPDDCHLVEAKAFGGALAGFFFGLRCGVLGYHRDDRQSRVPSPASPPQRG